jgi:hypothetical protein
MKQYSYPPQIKYFKSGKRYGIYGVHGKLATTFGYFGS